MPLSLRDLRLSLSEVYRTELELYRELRSDEQTSRKNLSYNAQTLTALARQIQEIDKELLVRRELRKLKKEKARLEGLVG